MNCLMIFVFIIIILLLLYLLGNELQTIHELFTLENPVFDESSQYWKSLVNQKFIILSQIPENLYKSSKSACDSITDKINTYASLINPDTSKNSAGLSGDHSSTITKINQNHFDLLESMRNDNPKLYCLLLNLSNTILNKDENQKTLICDESFKIKINNNDSAIIQFINLLLINNIQSYIPTIDSYNTISEYNTILKNEDIEKIIPLIETTAS